MRRWITTAPVLGALLVTLLACGSAGTGEPSNGEPNGGGPGTGGTGEPGTGGSGPGGGEPGTGEPEPVQGQQVPFETIQQASVPGKVGGQVREAVHDSAAWQRVWDDLTGGRAMAGQAAAVDFEREMVLAAAMPTQGCVSRVTIRGVTADGGGLVVDLLEQPPAEGVVCVTSERPFHAVRLARYDGPVRWEVETEPLDPSVD